MNRQPRILLLGSNLNPISIHCLKALVDTQAYQILVGIDRGNQQGLVQSVVGAWRRHGWTGVVRRIKSQLSASRDLRSNPAGSHSSIRAIAADRELTVFDVADINNRDVLKIVREFKTDLIVVANFSQIIRSRLISLPAHGVINFHPSLLPKYRGPTPFYWILHNQENESGVTIHFIDDARIDSGDIIQQTSFPLSADETEWSLREKSIRAGVPILVESVAAVLAGTVRRQPQDDEAMSYFGFAPRGASQL